MGVDNDVAGRPADKQRDVSAAIRRHALALERHPTARIRPTLDRSRRENALIDQ
jgi:hypothetical protein